MWSLFPSEEKSAPKTVTLAIKGFTGSHNATSAQIESLKEAAKLPLAEKTLFRNGQMTLVLPPQGLALIEVH